MQFINWEDPFVAIFQPYTINHLLKPVEHLWSCLIFLEKAKVIQQPVKPSYNMKNLSFLTFTFLLITCFAQAKVLPDLTVSNIKASSIYEKERTSITVNARFRVTGTSVGAYRASVYVSDRVGAPGDFLGYFDIPAQEANTSKYLSKKFLYNKKAEGKYLVIVVDQANSITESNEANNIASVIIKEVKADLLITSIGVSYTYDGTRSTIDVDAYVYLANRNVGTYQIAVYISDRPDNFGDFLGFIPVSSHTARTTKKVSNGYPFRFNGDIAGKYIVMNVDAHHNVMESNELNNVKSKQLPKPDLSSVSVNASYTYDGSISTVNVQAAVYLANASVGIYRIAAYLSDQPGVFGDFLGYIQVASQVANTATTVSKSFIRSVDANNKFVVLRLDAQNNVDEEDEGNNVGSSNQMSSLAARISRTSLEHQSSAVYPNPAINRINLRLSERTLVLIYNLQGKLISSEWSKAGTYSRDISQLEPGTYVIKASGNTKLFVKK